jgi:hypothetical protein
VLLSLLGTHQRFRIRFALSSGLTKTSILMRRSCVPLLWCWICRRTQTAYNQVTDSGVSTMQQLISLRKYWQQFIGHRFSGNANGNVPDPNEGLLRQTNQKIRQLEDGVTAWHDKTLRALEQNNELLATETLKRKWQCQKMLAELTGSMAPVRPQSVHEIRQSGSLPRDDQFFRPPEEPGDGAAVTRNS